MRTLPRSDRGRVVWTIHRAAAKLGRPSPPPSLPTEPSSHTMPLRDIVHDLELLVRSRHSLIHLDTEDAERAFALVRHLADRLGIPLFGWTRIQGLSREGVHGSLYGTEDPRKAFGHIAAADLEALYFFHDLPERLQEDDVLAAAMKSAAARLADARGGIVFAAEGVALPSSLRPVTTTVRLPGPSAEELRTLVGRILRDLSQRRHVEVSLSGAELTLLVNHLSGLTTLEAEKILTKAIIEDGKLGVDDIRHVIDAKRAVVEREGLLEYYPVEESLAEVADLATLKGWLEKRRAILADPDKAREFGLSFPRGVLLLGVPGCGKSLSAKAVARAWHLPLLKLDPSNLYNKYIGESERNFKRAVAAAERMSPVVLWIDELEKAFAQGGSEDGGVSQRILGSFLSWMQERSGDVFVVATANDISRLPPELLRKGRFDEIFFVDLPDAETRGEIFRIHLSSREQDPSRLDLAALADAAAEFSGAEIEQVVLSALYSAFSGGGTLTDRLLLDEIARTRPLAATMAERVTAMREWARDRAVRAN